MTPHHLACNRASNRSGKQGRLLQFVAGLETADNHVKIGLRQARNRPKQDAISGFLNGELSAG